MEPEQPAARKDRYDVTGNVEGLYVDEAQKILVNKRAITDLETLERLEEEGLFHAYEALLGQTRIDTPMTSRLLRHIHQQIFGDLYEWAGRWRTVTISKAGITWPPPTYLERAMDEFERTVLQTYPAAALENDDAFCRAASEMQGEFLAIHPFREGNARTIKLMTDLLAAQTGRPLLVYDASEEGRERYIAVAQAALTRDYGPMEDLIRQALAAARGG